MMILVADSKRSRGVVREVVDLSGRREVGAFRDGETHVEKVFQIFYDQSLFRGGYATPNLGKVELLICLGLVFTCVAIMKILTPASSRRIVFKRVRF